MSQLQPQQEQHQPVLVYPNTVTGQPPPNNYTNNSHHSSNNGSFGTVFIVLGIILVISVVACLLGRLCNRKIHGRQKPNQTHGFGPKRKDVNVHPKEGDLEFGVDKRIPNPNPVGINGETPRGFLTFENGDRLRSDMKSAEDHEGADQFKAGA